MNRQDIKDWLRVMLIVAGLLLVIGLCVHAVITTFAGMGL